MPGTRIKYAEPFRSEHLSALISKRRLILQDALGFAQPSCICGVTSGAADIRPWIRLSGLALLDWISFTSSYGPVSRVDDSKPAVRANLRLGGPWTRTARIDLRPRTAGHGLMTSLVRNMTSDVIRIRVDWSCDVTAARRGWWPVAKKLETVFILKKANALADTLGSDWKYDRSACVSAKSVVCRTWRLWARVGHVIRSWAADRISGNWTWNPVVACEYPNIAETTATPPFCAVKQYMVLGGCYPVTFIR